MPELNPEQRKAAEHGEGPLLVVAGPGTGKTRVITQRIVYLLREGSRLRPENILALTFTDKAAGEMKHRVAKALPGLETSPAISTFHSFCYQVLREHHEDRKLLDKIDVWIFLRRRLSGLGLEYYQKLAEPGAFLHDLNEFFSRCQDELIEPDDFDLYVRQLEQEFAALYPHGPGRASAPLRAGYLEPPTGSAAENLAGEEILRKKELARVFRTSRKMIEDSGSSSFGSLVSETVALWRHDSAALDQARQRFRAVLVDEFQDTNYAQVELLKLLVPHPYAITAVGDDDQAIYRFRGASHGAFDMFSRAFPGHQTVYLSQNYRSVKTILRAAGTVIARNDRYAMKPPLTSLREDGSPVTLLKTLEPRSEAVWIAEEIDRLAKKGVSYGSMAVLYRAHHLRDVLAQELGRRGVPVSIRGLSVLSAPVLRDLVAYLRVIHSPHENISLTRVLLAPRWRVPEPLAQSIRDRAAKDRCSLYDAIKKCTESECAAALTASGWDGLDKLLRTFRRLSRTASVAALLDRLLQRLAWHDGPGDPDRAALQAFRKFMKAWEEKSETRRLGEFVEYFNYFVEAGGKIEAPESASNAVEMMTVHAAKGLEFPVVFVIGVSPRRFPSTERKPVIEFPGALRKGPPPPRDIHLQEERRLFFVALTRARDRLYVSSVSKSAKQQSAFIQDLLSDPAVRVRDIEIIEIPDAPAEAAPASLPAIPPPTGQPNMLLSGSASGGQGQLFEDAEITNDSGNVHPLISAWAGQSVATEPSGRLRLSATSVEDYLACPLKYKFQHVLRIPTAPQAALTFGNLMHQCVRRYFELRRQTQTEASPTAALPSYEEMERYYLGHWKSLGFDDGYQEDTYRRSGLEQLRGFVERHNGLTMDASGIEMEQSFSLELGDIRLEGRIDQMNPLERQTEAAGPPEVELVDYKTGRPRTEKDAEKSLQLSVYALAAGRVFGRNPSRLTFYNLTSNDAVSTVRTPADLNDAEQKIRDTAVEIRAGSFEAAPGFICRWCNYPPICPAHEGS